MNPYYPFSRRSPRPLLLLLLFTISCACSAQMAVGLNKDSLRRFITRTPDDTAKISGLIYLGQQYENNQPDSAIYFYQEAGRICRLLNYPAGYIRYISNYTAVLNLRGRFKESLQLNLQAIDTCQKYHLDEISYMRVFVNTGNVYELIGDYTSSAAWYLKALPLAEGNGDAQRLSTLYNNLSGLYRNLSQPAKALDYANRALALAEKTFDLYSTGLACINLGNTLKDMGQMTRGTKYIERALSIGRRLQDSALTETALIDIGDSYLKTHQPDKYIPIYREALVLARTLGDISGQAFCLQGLAYGLFWTSRYKEAGTSLNEAISFARKNDQKEVWRDLLLLMSDLQAILKHMDSYRRFRALSDSVSDAILNETLLKNVQEMETKYEVEKKQHDLLKKDILLEEKDKSALRQRAWLITALSGAVVLALLFILTWVNSRQRQHLQRRTIQALTAEQENVRLRAILEGQQEERTRISQEMHDDMGSGLTSLLFLSRPLAGTGNETALKINQLAGQLIQKMNEIIWTLNTERDSLESLVAYIRTNTAQLLEHAGIEFRFDIHEPFPEIMVSQEFRRNIYLVAKEAVHNIVRHSGAVNVDISVKADDKSLEINIHDDGKGLDTSILPRRGNGLKNMQVRMTRLGGTINIGSDKGMTVVIRAPLV